MTTILEGQRFWKHGDHSHVWVVDAIVPAKDHRPAFAVLVSEEGRASEDVDLSHLANPNLYTPVP
jgi:hypothetical protein